MTDFNEIFGDLMKEVKATEKAKATLKRKDASPGELAEANRIRKEWIDAEWRDTAYGPMYLRQCCTNCNTNTQLFAGFYVEATHLTKKATRLTHCTKNESLEVDELVRFFREETVDFCAAPGCIKGFDNMPWKR